MRRFRFNLEGVLTVREKALQDARIELFKVTDAFNKQLEMLAKMYLSLNKIKKDSEKYLSQDNFNANIIGNYSSYTNKLVNNIRQQETVIEKMKLNVIKWQNIVKEAYIKVKSIEKLKEKKLKQYKKEYQLEEIKELDDIVNSRRKTA